MWYFINEYDFFSPPQQCAFVPQLIFLMKSCDTDKEFKQRLDKAAPKRGETLMLPYLQILVNNE